MEPILLASPSLLQRAHMFLLDLLFLAACVRRWFADNLYDRYTVLPQPFPPNQRPPYLNPGQTIRGANQDEQPDVSESRTKATSEETHGASASSETNGHASTSSSTAVPYQLRVLSLNIWGLPMPRTDVRTRELAKSFHLFDIVAFQECSHEREVAILRERALEAGLRYHHQFTIGVGFPVWHGVTAPGLVVFSRFPIIEMRFGRYSINGKMYQFQHADYMLAKGLGMVRIDVSEMAYPNVAPGQCRPVVGVDVFLTHLHANYTSYYYDWRQQLPTVHEMDRRLRDGESAASVASLMPIPLQKHVADEYLAHRVLQAYECARLIAAWRREDFLTLLCGDLNCPPYDLCMQIVQSLTFGQSPDGVPRFLDAFRQLHPESGGYTCGAKDNSFTFSAEPIRMERRPAEVEDLSEEDEDTTDSSTSHSLSDQQLSHRTRSNGSPSDPALMPADANLRVVSRATHGEHVTLLPSSSPLKSPSTSTASAAAPTTPPAEEHNPLAWVDAETAKRIDYVLFANPVARAKCTCAWHRMQLPYQTPTEAELEEAAATCTCPPAPTPAHTWKVAAASVFKQYMMEESGKMTSISDHHGVSVTFEFQGQPPSTAAPTIQTKQPTSTIIVSQLTPAPPSAAGKIESFLSVTRSPRKSASTVHSAAAQALEKELFTLDDGAVTQALASSNSYTPARRTSFSSFPSSTSTVGVVPALSTSSILLLAEGVLWFGLRDATDRRSAHLFRMLRNFVLFTAGSRLAWMYLLNRYFEEALADILPLWVAQAALSTPTSLATALRILLFIIDWGHTFLPIYIVLEWLCTTFPAKEEQMSLRQAIAELQRLREFSQARP